MDKDFDLDTLLAGFEEHVETQLASMPEVKDVDDLDLDELSADADEWVRLEEIVAVVADLKGSTKLATGKQRAESTASIYEAAIRPLVEILDVFDADDIAIQGDGAIGIFWGDARFERAMCAGITTKTFSEDYLDPALAQKWPGEPAVETGFKADRFAARTSGILPAVRAAGLEPLRFHDLRHTAAALAIRAGAHPKAIAERLGHASITTTLNTYGHLFPALDEELAGRLDDMARGASVARSWHERGSEPVAMHHRDQKGAAEQGVSEWALVVSNHRPPPCKGGEDGTATSADSQKRRPDAENE